VTGAVRGAGDGARAGTRAGAGDGARAGTRAGAGDGARAGNRAGAGDGAGHFPRRIALITWPAIAGFFFKRRVEYARQSGP
jgi:hypothetical protein